jgi:signal transduction histidine kinase
MDGLVGDLLAAARIDFEAVSPRELSVEDLARRALQLAKMSDDALVLVGDAGLVHADATLLARALSGMLDNACRYGGKRISLVVRDQGERIVFAVEDDGPGFPPGDEERAFEPFWRGQPGASKGEGLGLALVRQIATAHGGSAGASNRIGGGARVWLEIPR